MFSSIIYVYICRFASPVVAMLCAVCESIFHSWAQKGGHHKSGSHLKSAAKSSCQICAAVLDTLQWKGFDIHQWGHQLPGYEFHFYGYLLELTYWPLFIPSPTCAVSPRFILRFTISSPWSHMKASDSWSFSQSLWSSRSSLTSGNRFRKSHSKCGMTAST